MPPFDIFHDIVIPILAGLVLTAVKLMVDNRAFEWDLSNDVALDLILVGAGVIVAFNTAIANSSASRVMDAAIGDSALASVLLVFRYVRRQKVDKHRNAGSAARPVGWRVGTIQLIVGVGGIVWAMNAF